MAVKTKAKSNANVNATSIAAAATPAVTAVRKLFRTHDFIAHAGQMPQPGDWTDPCRALFRQDARRVALVEAAARYDRNMRFALVGATLGDARSVMVGSDAGNALEAPLSKASS